MGLCSDDDHNFGMILLGDPAIQHLDPFRFSTRCLLVIELVCKLRKRVADVQCADNGFGDSKESLYRDEFRGIAC